MSSHDLPGAPEQRPASLDPMLQVVARWHQHPEGPLSRDFAPGRGPLGLQVRVHGELSVARRRLGARGVRLGRCLGQVCAASLEWKDVPGVLGGAMALGIAGAERMEVAWSPLVLLPQETRSQRPEARLIHQHPVTPLKGAGVIVASLDSGIDPLHPSLFHADGGRFPWVDVDGDGELTLGRDGVDLNGNRKIDFNETLQLLDATRVEDFEAGKLTNMDAVFQAHEDWLYVDFNRNGRRDAGRKSGFFESDPGYGESLFVLEDFDKDGQASPWESLVMLGTSKVVKFIHSGQVYERGKDLIEAAAIVQQAEGAFHGTAVAGVLLGGQVGHHELVGVAPGAEVMVLGYLGSQGQVADELRQTPWQLEYLAQVAASLAKIVLHEWTDPFLQPLDGSTLLEEAMASMSDRVHVVPLGNLNLSQKHTQKRVEPGKNATMAFVVVKTLRDQLVSALVGSLQWRGGSEGVSLMLRDPAGGRHPISPQGVTSLRVAGTAVEVAFESTRGGTTFGRMFFEATTPGDPVAPGEWAFELESTSRPIWAIGRLSDLHSGWRPGVGWSEPTQDEMTLSYPATAPAAVGVAAVSALDKPQDYSGRGPTLDGRPGVWVAAPDQGMAPVAQTQSFVDAGWGAGWYAPFGGTSAAAPYVAGTLALILSASPGLEPEQLRQRLAAGVKGPPRRTQSPETGWGVVDLWRTFHQEEPPEAQALLVRAEGREDREFWTLDATASVGWTAMRFDLEGDGHFESDWKPVASWSVAKGSVSRPDISQIQARNEAGEVMGGRVVWSAEEAAAPEAREEEGMLQGGCGVAGKRGGGTNFLWWVVSFGTCLLRRRRHG